MRGIGALYIHIPFCARKCAYCDFTSQATDSDSPLIRKYLNRVYAQLDEVAALGMLDELQTAYIGGGTPSILSAEALVQLIEHICNKTPSLVELTVEANPESLDVNKINALKTAGATRISIGVQSLADKELIALGRIHTAETAKQCVASAVDSGLDVSLDLMCAIPKQTNNSWHNTLTQALELGVDHISIYPLQLEDGTPLAAQKDNPIWNSSDCAAYRMEVAASLLASNGYKRYEVASYARNNKCCKHNMAYWQGVSYLGLGVSAASMLDEHSYKKLQSIAHQLPKGDDLYRIRMNVSHNMYEFLLAQSFSQLSFEMEFLDESQALAEDLMLSARMSEGIGDDLYIRAQEVLGASRVNNCLERCIHDGLIDQTYSPTNKGWLLGNELYGRLWELSSSKVKSCHIDGYNPQRL